MPPTRKSKKAKGAANNNATGETPWNDQHPARQLLYNEIKSGAIPLDEEDMGPAQVYYNYSNTIEFQMDGMEYGAKFTRRLKSLRKQIKAETEPRSSAPEWNEDHPARKLLYDELRAGRIPVNREKMGPAEVYYRCSATLEFQMEGMEYGSTFTGRLLRLRKLVKEDKKRARKDKLALVKSLKVHPPPVLNRHGRPQYNGSLAQMLLKNDISEGKHKTMLPHELYAQTDREAYRITLSQDAFRWKIQQEIRTAKYLHTLKYRSDEKLRATLEKEGVLDASNNDGED